MISAEPADNPLNDGNKSGSDRPAGYQAAAPLMTSET